MTLADPLRAALLALTLTACAPAAGPPGKPAPRALPITPVTKVEPGPEPAKVGPPSLPVANWNRAAPARCRGFSSTSAYDPQTGESRGKLSLRASRIRAVVVGSLARTEVEEELANDQARAVEALFSFVLPADASLSRLALARGNRWLEGRVFDSDQIALIPRGPPTGPAKAWSASDDDTLGLRLVSLAAKQRQRLRLTFDAALEQHAGRDVYRYSMSKTPCLQAPLPEFSLELTLLGAPESFGKVTTPNYPAEIRASADRVLVTLDRRAFVPDQDFTVELEHTTRPRVELGVAVSGWKKSPVHELLEPPPATLSGASESAHPIGHVSLGLELPELPTSHSGAAKRPPARVIVLDKSYSQSAASFALQRQLVERLLSLGAANERYTLLACDSACAEWPTESVGPSSAARAASVATWLGTLAPSGSFDLEGALAAAVARLEPTSGGQIVHLGAGRVSAGTLDRAALFVSATRLLTRRAADFRIFALGPARDEALLLGLAKATGASYRALSETIPVELQASDMHRALNVDKLSEVKIELPPGIHDPSPAQLPALLMGHPFRVTARVAARVAAPSVGMIRVSGKLRGRDYVTSYPIAITPDAEPNPLVARHWARERLREGELTVTDSPFQFGASQLSRSARIATRYTDWLLLENEQAYDEYGLTPAHRPAPNTVPEKPRAASAKARPPGLFPERAPDGLVSSPTYTPEHLQYPLLNPRVTASIGTVMQAGDGDASPAQDVSTDTRNDARGLKSLFRTCYGYRVAKLDWFEGRIAFSLRTSPRGTFESLAAEATPARDIRALFSCLRSLAGRYYEPRPSANRELQFSVDFAVYWQRGLLAFSPAPDNSIPGGDAVSSTITLGNTPVIAHDARERQVTAALKAPTQEQAILAALRGVEKEPGSLAALDLLAATAGAYQASPLANAALEAELALFPEQPELRRRAVRAWLRAGDERRACAHLRSLAEGPSAPILALSNTLCRTHWLAEPALPAAAPTESASIPDLIRHALAELDQRPCDPFTVNVQCAAPQRCPTAVVLTSEGQLISPFGRIPGQGGSDPLSFWPATLGKYRVLLLGGDPLAHGTVDIGVHLEKSRVEFHRGGPVQSVASVELQQIPRGPDPTSGIPICRGAPN